MDLLDEKQIAGMRKHKYESEGKSILEPFFIPLWNYIAARIIPKRFSQHAVTLIGLLSAIIPCSILLYFCHNGDTKVSFIEEGLSLTFILFTSRLHVFFIRNYLLENQLSDRQKVKKLQYWGI